MKEKFEKYDRRVKAIKAVKDRLPMKPKSTGGSGFDAVNEMYRRPTAAVRGRKWEEWDED